MSRLNYIFCLSRSFPDLTESPSCLQPQVSPNLASQAKSSSSQALHAVSASHKPKHYLKPAQKVHQYRTTLISGQNHHSNISTTQSLRPRPPPRALHRLPHHCRTRKISQHIPALPPNRRPQRPRPKQNRRGDRHHRRPSRRPHRRSRHTARNLCTRLHRRRREPHV